jgi:hypothetical protein
MISSTSPPTQTVGHRKGHSEFAASRGSPRRDARNRGAADRIGDSLVPGRPQRHRAFRTQRLEFPFDAAAPVTQGCPLLGEEDHPEYCRIAEPPPGGLDQGGARGAGGQGCGFCTVR